MGKRGDDRAMALAVILRRGKNGASAFDIGAAMLAARPPHHRRENMAAKERVGLEMAARLVHEGVVVATRFNRFMLIKHKGRAVPPPFDSDPSHQRTRVEGTFGPASDVRILVKEGVAQVGK